MTPGKIKGKFLSVEGSEGAGKSTQIPLLVKYLQSRQLDVVSLREPGSTVIGEEIRSLFKDPARSQGIFAETELLLLQASRAQLVREKIVPALLSGQWVVCDRFFHSTVFYQGFGRKMDQEIITASTLMATNGLVPDLTILLTLPLDLAMERVRQRSKLDRIEEEPRAFFERVQQGVEWLASNRSPKILTVNGNQTVEKVQADIMTGVAERMFGQKTVTL